MLSKAKNGLENGLDRYDRLEAFGFLTTKTSDRFNPKDPFSQSAESGCC
jgi:hypothetical protein